MCIANDGVSYPKEVYEREEQNYSACYDMGTGIVISIQPVNHVWSDIENGRIPGPHGEFWSTTLLTTKYYYSEIVAFSSRYVYIIQDPYNPGFYDIYDRENPEDLAVITERMGV